MGNNKYNYLTDLNEIDLNSLNLNLENVEWNEQEQRYTPIEIFCKCYNLSEDRRLKTLLEKLQLLQDKGLTNNCLYKVYCYSIDEPDGGGKRVVWKDNITDVFKIKSDPYETVKGLFYYPSRNTTEIQLDNI